MLYDIILLELFTFFFIISWLITITMTMLSDVTDVWQNDHNIILTLISSLEKKNKLKENKKEILNKKLMFRLCISDIISLRKIRSQSN